MKLIIGNRYNWVNQAERLVYKGKVGSWHQFAKVEYPDIVWCEVLDSDLRMIEETAEPAPAEPEPNPDELPDGHPLWLVNEQIKGLLEGDGSSEDHADVLAFLRKTGLPESTVNRVHQSVVFGDRKLRPEVLGPAPFKLPVSIEGQRILVAADLETIAEVWAATEEELAYIVNCVNAQGAKS